MSNRAKIWNVLYVIVGALCICYPLASSFSVEIIVGIAMLCGAFFALAGIPSSGGFWRGLLCIVLAAIYAIGGACMLMFPSLGIVAVAFALGAVFFAEGVLMLVYWCAAQNSAVALFNAVISLVLGVLVLANISDALWFLGVLVGIDLVFRGIFGFMGSPNKIPICKHCESKQ